jgi:mannose-6-phosphate isomerase-like protein (cupin superfamily)
MSGCRHAPLPEQGLIMEQHETLPPHGPDNSILPRYDGPLSLAQSLSAFALASSENAQFTRDGPRADVEYRDLGLAAATNGRIGIKHVRAIMPLPAPTGWHWHDMTAHFVFVLKGSLTFRFAGIDGDVVVAAGSGISQPAGVAHNVVARSDDLELLEINVPAQYGTFDLAASKDAVQR